MNDKHLKKIIDKQFKIANINAKYEDVCQKSQPDLFNKYTYSEEDNLKWKKWTINYMRDKMKLTKDKAFIETEWLNLNYGLRVVSEDRKKKNKK
jgi:hypothetical protein